MIDVKSVVLDLRGVAETEIEDIRKCLITLYTVRKGEQPLDRDLGLDWSFLDLPVNLAKNRFALEVIEKTRIYEPRVQVMGVEFLAGEEGRMVPVIHLEGGEKNG